MKINAPKLKAATKAEFDTFIKSYGRDLVRDVYGACEPPLVTYNDFTLGNWPASTVASHQLGGNLNDPPPYNSPEAGWRILTSTQKRGIHDRLLHAARRTGIG